MRKRKPGPIADEQEVLALFTGVMRGEVTEETPAKNGGEPVRTPPKISERCKAAEYIGKYHGLFDRKEESRQDSDITLAVMAMLADMHARREDPSAPDQGSP